jgi:hypothetical protein
MENEYSGLNVSLYVDSITLVLTILTPANL